MDTQPIQQHTPLVDYKLLDNVADKRIFRKPHMRTNKRDRVDLDNVATNTPKQLPRKTVASEKRLTKAKTKGVQPRSLYYLYAQQFTQEAIEMMVYLMRTSRNENVRMGAARSILDKSIPDLKALEISGELKQQYTLQLQQYAPTDPLQAFKAQENIIDGQSEAKTDTSEADMSQNKYCATLSSLETEQSNTISPEVTDSTPLGCVEATQKL